MTESNRRDSAYETEQGTNTLPAFKKNVSRMPLPWLLTSKGEDLICVENANLDEKNSFANKIILAFANKIKIVGLNLNQRICDDT